MQQLPRPPRPPQPRSRASVALEAWLTATGRHQTDLARELGISRARVSAYARGVLVPKLDVATELDHRSRGAVALQDWRIPAVVPTEEDAAPCADTSPQLAHSSVTPWPSPRPATGKRPRSRVGRRRSPAT